MTNLTDITLSSALDGLAAKKFSASDLTHAYVKAVEKCDSLNAYIEKTPELALTAAKESDARYAKGEAKPLDVGWRFLRPHWFSLATAHR
jgi:aspartyl-tRNA(Asn)/glutamyl-tRNA(Gln) amidotransferase subunit A